MCFFAFSRHPHSQGQGQKEPGNSNKGSQRLFLPILLLCFVAIKQVLT